MPIYAVGTRLRLTCDVWHGYTHRAGEMGAAVVGPSDSLWLRTDKGDLVNAWPHEVEPC